MKSKKTVTTMKTTSGSITDYRGNFIYADNQLITIFAGDVRVAPVNFGNSTYWKYEYSMKDHLGNTRVVFAAHSYGQPELLQQTSYYPFGMTMQQQNFYSQNTTKNKYLYNSKELQDDQLVGNTCYLPNKGTEFSHLSWPRGVYGDVPGDGEEFMGGGSHTPFLEYRKKNKKVVEKKVEQGDFNNFDLFDFYVSSFETPGMSFNVQIHPDIDGEETEEEKKTAGQGGDSYQNGHGETIYTMDQFLSANKGLTRSEIINQRQDRSKTFLGSQPGGPNMRYVVNPHDGRVLDMRHMLVVGKQPAAVGNLLEVFQWSIGQASGMDPQDFYSNGVGYQFYMQYSGIQNLFYPSTFTDQMRNFFYSPRVIYNW
jgi:hypothetical protein